MKPLFLKLTAETDFVARGETFIQIVEDSAKLLLKHLPKTHEEADALIQPLFNEATLKIGEKLSFRRFKIIKASAENVFAYKHMGGKITSVVVLEKADQELARGLAMHIAANNPSYIKKDDIPQSEVEKETRIQTEAAKNDEELAKKPANILERIVAGRVSKAFNDNTLSEQVYLLDGEKKVGVVLKELEQYRYSFCSLSMRRFEKRKATSEQLWAQSKIEKHPLWMFSLKTNMHKYKESFLS